MKTLDEAKCKNCGKTIRIIWGPPQPQEFTDNLTKQGIEYRMMGCLVPSAKEMKEMASSFLCSNCQNLERHLRNRK